MKRSSLAICLMLISILVRSQTKCLPPTYTFNGMVNISGTGGLGSIYRFSNSITGVNTFVTISKLQNATITNSNIDVLGSYALAWQPTINFTSSKSSGDSSYVEFTFTFVDIGTGPTLNSISNNPIGQQCMAMTIIDCDGPGNSNTYREMVKVSQTATLKGITNSTITVAQDSKWISLISGPTQFNSIDTINYGAMAQINFPDKTDRFKIRVGAVGAVTANLTREYSFYFKSFTGLNVTLPVNLFNFNSKLINKSEAYLNWSTASEQDADRFDVYRSYDGVGYEYAGTVNASGNSHDVVNYSFTDQNLNSLNSHVVFYKLKMVENNGHFEWSDITKLPLSDKAEGTRVFTLSPNPSTTYLNLDLAESSSSDVQVEILDIYGKCVLKVNQPEIISDNAVRLDVSSLSKGMYFVHLMNDSGNETNSVKFVKM